MHRRLFSCLLTLTICLGGSTRVWAVYYSEFLTEMGDLSNVGANPTKLTLTYGANTLFGEASAQDVDFLQITVPTNFVLDAINVIYHQDVNRVYAGLQAGPVWTAGTGSLVDASQLLGWYNFPFNPNHSGTHTNEDILDDISLGAGSTGFVAPLESGVYTFMFQTAGAAVTYGLNFSISTPDASIPGDFNGDLEVDGDDLFVWRSSYGRTPDGDANADGVTDGADFLIWQRNHGLTFATTTAHAVPEPAAALLALSAFAALAARRRRR